MKWTTLTKRPLRVSYWRISYRDNATKGRDWEILHSNRTVLLGQNSSWFFTFWSEMSVCFFSSVFGLYLISLLCCHHSFNIIIFFLFLSSLFLFGRFDECLIFSLIVSLWCEFFFKEWECHIFFSFFLWLLSLTNYFIGFFVIKKYGNPKW